MLEFSTHYQAEPIIPAVFKINLASICADFQKRLFDIQIRLFAGEVEPYVDINAQDHFSNCLYRACCRSF
jgi:hypothetical protein